MNDAVGGILVAIGAGFLGWIIAHSEVARECERLGAFYVGGTVYQCQAKEQR